ncbi:MAG: helix-hairpin-helix domain-containing protein [Phycisphaerales bacterium]
MSRRTRVRDRSGFATALVIWAVALAAVILVSLQIPAYRQAIDGREVAARVRATWAARAGVERVIARLQLEAEAADPFPASTLLSSLEQDAEGQLDQASYLVGKYDPASASGIGPGAADAQSKLNVNVMTFDDLMLVPDMTEEVADAILDYIDADDDIREAGAESETYTTMPASFKARNAPIRDLRELELVIGVVPELLRGEDWNLNGLLDPNENDGDASFPRDNADGILDAGWSALLTAAGTTGGLGPSGLERIDLSTAEASEIAQALGVDDQQAETIATYAQGGSAKLEDFIEKNLSTIAQEAGGGAAAGGGGGRGGGGGGRTPRVQNLTREQLGTLLNECVIGDPALVSVGKLNVNTCSPEALESISAIDPTMRDAILLYRDQAGGDMLSIAELLEIPQMTAGTLAQLFPYLDVRSNVFVVTSRGRDAATGITVELIAEIDRSTQPATLRKVTVR